jgi:3-oxoacyl-[acyl-carrier protein] reductase
LSAPALTRHGILANAVAPGFIQTAMWDSFDQQFTERGNFGPGEIKRVGIAATPIGRPTVPLEAASCICFLLSDDSHYVSGHTLDENGAAVARAPIDGRSQDCLHRRRRSAAAPCGQCPL